MQTAALIPADVLPLLVEYRAARKQADVHTLFCEIEQVENTLALSGRTAEEAAVVRVRVAIGMEHRARIHDEADLKPFSIPNTYGTEHPLRMSHAQTKARFHAEAAKVAPFLDSICKLAAVDAAMAEVA